MDVKRYFRAPIMWIVLAVLAVIVLMQVVSDSSGSKTVDTSQIVAAINSNQAKSVQITTGDSNLIKVELRDGQKLPVGSNGKVPSGSKFQASYIGDQGAAVAADLSKNPGLVPNGYTVVPEKQSPSSACCCRCCRSSSSCWSSSS